MPPPVPDPDPELDPDRLALDEESVERLLAGGVSAGQAPAGYGEVAELLAAVAAPPRPEELAGLPTVLAQLRATTRPHPHPRPRPRPHSRPHSRPRPAVVARRVRGHGRRRRSMLAVVVVVGALAGGGAAAAASGHLPRPVADAARSILGGGGGEGATPGPPGRGPAPTTPSPGSGASRPGDQGQPPAGATNPGPGSPPAGAAADPALKGLCRAYAAGNGPAQANQLDAAAFQALTRAAGGTNNIPTYCQAINPGNAKPKHQPQQPPDDQGQGQGQGGPPPSTGGGNQGQGGQPETPSPSR